MNEIAAQVLPATLLASVFAAAIRSDLRSRRISNRLVIAGWIAAFTWHILGPPGDWTFDPVSPGAAGVGGALIGLLALLLAFLPFYVLRVMGAGDVKLLSVVGAFFGVGVEAWSHLAGVSLFILASGGVLALLRIAVSQNGAAVASNLRLIFASYVGRLNGLPAPEFDARTDSADRMPYAIAIAVGTTLYLVAKWAEWISLL